jgi:SAM-dependent methyltransferase
MRYPADRPCPITSAPAAEVLAYVPARVVARENPTYRSNFADILQIHPDDEFPIAKGPTGFVYSGWSPPEAFLRAVYEDVIDHSRTLTQSVGYRRLQLEFGAALLQEAERRAKRERPLRLLDYGCGYGALLRMLAGREIQCMGYEPSQARGERAAQDGFEITADLEQVVAGGPYDLLVLTEVLEHVPEPRQLLRFLKAVSAPGALLAITVPDCEPDFVQQSLASLAHGRLPLVFNPWEHLNYFSASSLRTLLDEEGFRVINDFGRTRPAVDASARFGDQPDRGVLINAARIIKRMFSSQPSTELFCLSTGPAAA